jgi:hypothetical protein
MLDDTLKPTFCELDACPNKPPSQSGGQSRANLKHSTSSLPSALLDLPALRYDLALQSSVLVAACGVAKAFFWAAESYKCEDLVMY